MIRIYMRILVIGIVLAVLSIPVAAQSPRTVIVKMTADGFLPDIINVSLGDRVVFVNEDSSQHWPASDPHPSHTIYPEFDPGGQIAPDESWSIQILRMGVWRFHDHINPDSRGILYVRDDWDYSGSAPKNVEAWIGTSRLWYELIIKHIQKAIFLQQYQESYEKFSVLSSLVDNLDSVRVWMRMEGYGSVIKKFHSELGNESLSNCHSLAHRLGRIVYETAGIESITKLSTICVSGLYHGVLDAYMFVHGTDDLTERLSQICNQFTSSFDSFACFHSVGHGFLVASQYDLPAAVDACLKFETSRQRRDCNSGVFMENSFAGLGIGIGHSTAWINDDLEFPCKSISMDEDVQIPCKQDEFTRIFEANGEDVNASTNYCRRQQSSLLVDECYRGFGFHIASSVVRDFEKIVQICTHLAEEAQDGCMQGAVTNIVSYYGNNIDIETIDVCDKFSERFQLPCYQTLGQQLRNVFGSQDQEVRKRCEQIQSKGKIIVSACVAGGEWEIKN